MNILFDLDGTLTDPFLGITNCIKSALEEMEIESPDDLRWCIGPPLQESFKELLKDHPDKDFEEAVRLYRARFEKGGMFENELYEGITDLLELLKRNDHRMFVATSKPHVYAKKIINHFNLRNYFVEVYGAELDGTRRNKADLIAYVLEKECLDPTTTVMIGDRIHDLVGAHKNEVQCVGITWGYGSTEELSSETPNAICNTPQELQVYFGV